MREFISGKMAKQILWNPGREPVTPKNLLSKGD
jgi:hypothetical protein